MSAARDRERESMARSSASQNFGETVTMTLAGGPTSGLRATPSAATALA